MIGSRRNQIRIVLGVLLLSTTLLGFAACGGDDITNNTVTVSDAWVESSRPDRDYTPAYMTIKSEKPDTLIDANVDETVAGHTLLFMTHQGGDPSKYYSHVVEPGDDGRLFPKGPAGRPELAQEQVAAADRRRLIPPPVEGGPRADQVDEIVIRHESDSYNPQEGGVPMHSFGYFLMLAKLPKQLKSGRLVSLKLEFENAGTIEVPAKVRAQQPRSKQAG